MAREKTPNFPPQGQALTVTAEAAPDRLSGQYYVLIGYTEKPKDVFRTVISSSKADILSRPTKNEKPESTDNTPQVKSLLSAYRKLSGYAIVGNDAATELSFLPDIKLEIALDRETGKSIELIKDRPKHRLYVSKSLDLRAVNWSVEKYWHAYQSGYAVQNAIFVGMVSLFDEMIAKLVRDSLKAKPELINSFGLEIPYKDIVAASDFDDLRSSIIEDTVQSLMWKGRTEQLKWIEKNITKGDFSKIIPAYDRFIEITERRNIYVHNDGIANRQYYKSLRDAGIKVESEIIGSRIGLGSDYFLAASDVLLESYVVIAQSVVRKLLKGASAEEREFIDSEFNDAIYYQIENGRCESADRLGEAMLGSDFTVSDAMSKMATVNRAIAQKKCGNAEEAEKLLSGMDWSSAKEEFHLCVAAVREDFDEVARLVPKLRHSDWIKPRSYFDWPAFEWMRSRAEFWQLLEKEYGEEIRRAVETAPEEATTSVSKRSVVPDAKA